MRLAWFRSRPDDVSDPFDSSAAVLARLREAHQITLFTAADAHGYPVSAFHAPYDLCVYELDGSSAAEFIWPHLVRVPGLVVLAGDSLHDSRSRLLERLGRRGEYRDEFAFSHGMPPPPFGARFPRGRWSMTRTAVLASRLVATWDVEAALAIEARHGRPVRVVAPAVSEPAALASSGAARTPGSPGAAELRVAVFGTPRPSVAGAVRRARDSGTEITLVPRATAAVAAGADAVLALQWPSAGEPLTPALTGMAAGRPVIVLECEATAGWPALDPQTWQPRDPITRQAPAVVALDPRDEEHSLLLAFRRLAGDVSLREALGRGARALWEATATPAHGVASWEAVLTEAAASPAPALPADWPAHLAADGTAGAREALRPFGLELDDLLYGPGRSQG